MYNPETKRFGFPNVQLQSTNLERESNLLSKTLVLEIHETYFEVPKSKKKGEEVEPI